MKSLGLGLAVGISGLFGVPALASQCVAESGPQTTALVELYTSEGCDSCPPADRWLSSLRSRGHGLSQVVPIALHVDYWDYIGWKDPFAKAAFSARQKKLAQVQRARIVYTPQVMLQGQDFRGWQGAAFDRAVAQINATPAGARIALAFDAAVAGAFRVQVRAALHEARAASDAHLFLASYENKLVSSVAAGENRGKTLIHDFVVFEWHGPFAFGVDGRLAERRDLPLLPKAVPGHSGVVAFVQSRSSARVLQALMLPVC